MVGQMEYGIVMNLGARIRSSLIVCIFLDAVYRGGLAVLQVMMGSKTDKFMGGKGTEQNFGDYCRHSAESLSSSPLFFNSTFLLSILGFHLEGLVT